MDHDLGMVEAEEAKSIDPIERYGQGLDGSDFNAGMQVSWS